MTGNGKLSKICYRKIELKELSMDLFRSFQRRQVVTDCWRKENDCWVIRSDPFIDDWSAAEYEELIKCLKNTISTGGLVYGAFVDNKLKGFVSVESALTGSHHQYMDLSSIHVSQEMRGQGIGRELFSIAKDFARARNAKKLYISAHSAVESQAFYHAMGCSEAEEYDLEHVAREPYDCQLECQL